MQPLTPGRHAPHLPVACGQRRREPVFPPAARPGCKHSKPGRSCPRILTAREKNDATNYCSCSAAGCVLGCEFVRRHGLLHRAWRCQPAGRGLGRSQPGQERFSDLGNRKNEQSGHRVWRDRCHHRGGHGDADGDPHRTQHGRLDVSQALHGVGRRDPGRHRRQRGRRYDQRLYHPRWRVEFRGTELGQCSGLPARIRRFNLVA